LETSCQPGLAIIGFLYTGSTDLVTLWLIVMQMYNYYYTGHMNIHILPYLQ